LRQRQPKQFQAAIERIRMRRPIAAVKYLIARCNKMIMTRERERERERTRYSRARTFPRPRHCIHFVGISNAHRLHRYTGVEGTRFKRDEARPVGAGAFGKYHNLRKNRSITGIGAPRVTIYGQAATILIADSHMHLASVYYNQNTVEDTEGWTVPRTL
jgi:hypothetical protein